MDNEMILKKAFVFSRKKMDWVEINSWIEVNKKETIMTDEKILRKAIKKAVENGWVNKTIRDFAHTNDIIFSHSFAQKFWGEEDHKYNNEFEGECKCGDNNVRSTTLKCWQYHLQQMVLEEQPLKYLKRFLDEKKTP